MEDVLKRKVFDEEKENVRFQIIEWYAHDKDAEEIEDEEGSEEVCEKKNLEYIIKVFGVTENGNSISCTIKNYKPYYYIKVDDDIKTKSQLKTFLEYIKNHYSLKKIENIFEEVSIKLCKKKDLFGFNNGKECNFIKLVFNSYSAFTKSRYLFKQPLNIFKKPGVSKKYKLYESNFEPFLRYCHNKDLKTAGWIEFNGKYKKVKDTTTNLEVEIDYKDVRYYNKNTYANFLQASWDIECYSHDYSFPSPEKKENVIYQIATVFKYLKDDTENIIKHIFTLKNCNLKTDITKNIYVEECKTEIELILKWATLINKMDPDIMYTYNGDTFDAIYTYTRAKLYRKENELMRLLSRVKTIPAEIKKEFFSSSAYGDNEYNRFYIPGRLNYDLLTHYKRGNKKYSSYKLDYIANEILKEGKNDITPKQIFKYYESGDAEKIKEIAEYCIKDCELLQKLVDKQLILSSIIQLANVTYVPISYLSTKGQTIKVYSQLLRKATHMNFLVPHTNFNEDTYPVSIKFRSTQNIRFNDYLQISFKTDKRPMYIKIQKTENESQNYTGTTSTELEHSMFNVYCETVKCYCDIIKLDELCENSFTGATVLTAKAGYYSDNIAILDFASLYPTCMISRNLCYSTIVLDDKYRNIEGIEYEEFEWDDTIEYKINHVCNAIVSTGISKGKECGKQAFFEEKTPDSTMSLYYCRIHDPKKKEREKSEKFAKKNVKYHYTIVQNVKGVLPSLLEELYSERKIFKYKEKEAYENGNKEEAEIFNILNLATKVSLNSIYGFVSRSVGNMILKPLGQLTTYIGRTLIEDTRTYAENGFINFINENNLSKLDVIIKNNGVLTKEEEEYLSRFRIVKKKNGF
jgi:DNA polymerase elongation subunit (family B)